MVTCQQMPVNENKALETSYTIMKIMEMNMVHKNKNNIFLRKCVLMEFMDHIY